MIDITGYSTIAISISGGKDSQTIMDIMMRAVREQSYSGQVVAIHADTGAEWPESQPHCQMLCDHYKIPLKVAIPFRALPDHIERRCAMMAVQQPRGKPGWPSPQQRYCTSDCKRAPIEKMLRPFRGNVLSVTGERRQESSHRAKLPELDGNKKLTIPGRTVTQYRPALDLTIEDVWRGIRESGLPRHVAYDLGNERLSCAICMLASEGDICRGAERCPALATRYLNIESEYGFTMCHKKSLAEILARGKERAA